MIAPTWGEIAERAKLLLWQQLREIRRAWRRRRFAVRERRRAKAATMVPLSASTYRHWGMLQDELTFEPGRPIRVRGSVTTGVIWIDATKERE